MTPNWSNRKLWTGDNLDVMRGIDSQEQIIVRLVERGIRQ